MNWYIAKIIFNININDGEHSSQFDESFRFIEASGIHDALLKARSLGRQNETSFINAEGKTVLWKFIDVADVHPLEELKHGIEFHSATHMDDEATRYIHFVHSRANALVNSSLVLS